MANDSFRSGKSDISDALGNNLRRFMKQEGGTAPIGPVIRKDSNQPLAKAREQIQTNQSTSNEGKG